VTVDTMVQGVHWDSRLAPADVGFKAVAASVSDLAACGARPRWMLLSLSLPRRPEPDAWVAKLRVGLSEACAAFGVHLVGGDVTAVPHGAPRVVSTTLEGRCVAAPLTRSGARAGDLLWVTGTCGLAGAGWMDPAPAPAALDALRRPVPPLPFALALAASGHATAAMDLSDGLATDLPRLARASGVAIEVDPARLPAHPTIAGHPQRRRYQLAGGEDYQLLFTAPSAKRAAIEELAASLDTQVTAVGSVREGSGATATDGAWPRPFAHFAPPKVAP